MPGTSICISYVCLEFTLDWVDKHSGCVKLDQLIALKECESYSKRVADLELFFQNAEQYHDEICIYLNQEVLIRG